MPEFTDDPETEIEHAQAFVGGAMLVRSSQQYGVDDTRAAGVKVGDTMSITCVRTWQYAGTDGFDCNFVSLDPQADG